MDEGSKTLLPAQLATVSLARKGQNHNLTLSLFLLCLKKHSCIGGRGIPRVIGNKGGYPLLIFIPSPIRLFLAVCCVTAEREKSHEKL